jgi:hypothetical protein
MRLVPKKGATRHSEPNRNDSNLQFEIVLKQDFERVAECTQDRGNQRPAASATFK